MLTNRGRVVFGVLFAALVLAVAATSAIAQENRFKVYVAAGFLSPLDSSDAELGEQVDKIEVRDEIGFGVGFEWRPNPVLGLELDYFGASQDIEFGGARIAETDVAPLTLAVNFHFARKHRFDVYVGPLVSYVSWGEIEFTPEIAAAIGQSSVSAESETAVGAQIGVDITVNSRFAIVTGVRYLDFSITPEGATATGSLGVDPLIVRVGAAWRW